MDFKKYFEKNPPKKLSDKDEIAIKLGALITSARLYKGFSQAKLAKKIGTQQPSLARAESGEMVPSIEFLYKIAKAIGNKTIFLEKLSDIFGLQDSNRTETKTYSFEFERSVPSEYVRNIKVSNKGSKSVVTYQS